LPQCGRNAARFAHDSARIENPIRFLGFVMPRHIDTGFHAPVARTLGNERRRLAFSELIATVALMLGIVVAAIAVTAGIARADVGAGIIDNESGVFAIALVLGLVVFIGLGTLTLTNRRPRH
jgi:hypothetical protein